MKKLKNKFISIIIIFSIIINIMPNFSVFCNKVRAASDTDNKKIIVEIDDGFGIQESGGNRFISVKLYLNNITADLNVYNIQFYINFDNQKLRPATKNGSEYSETTTKSEFFNDSQNDIMTVDDTKCFRKYKYNK